MSLSIDVNVAVKNFNSCLISLPSTFIYPILDSTNLLVQQVVLHLNNFKTGKRIASVGWNGNTTNDLKSIEIDSQYAKLLNIKKGTKITVELDLTHANNPQSIASSVEIEPLTTVDWELTEIHAQAIESTFLSQVRCVQKDHLLIIHAHPNSTSSSAITFKVIKIKTPTKEVDFAKIGNDTELHIIPKPHNNNLAETKQTNVPAENSPKRKNMNSKESNSRQLNIIKRSVVLKKGSGMCIYNRGPKLPMFENCEFVQIQVIEGPGTPSYSKKVTTKENQIGVPEGTFGNVIIARYIEESVEDDNNEFDLSVVKQESFFISPLLATSLGLDQTCGELLCVEPYSRRSVRLGIENCTINIRKLATSDENAPTLNEDSKIELKNGSLLGRKSLKNEKNKQIIEVLRTGLIEMYGEITPLTNGMRLPVIPKILPEGAILELHIKDSKANEIYRKRSLCTWTLLKLSDETNSNVDDADTKKNLANSISLKIGKDLLVPRSRIQQQQFPNTDIEVHGQDKKLDLLRNSLYDNVSTLLYGKSGSGKSAICKFLAQEFYDNGYYVKIVDFSKVGTMKGKFTDQDSEYLPYFYRDEDEEGEDENNATGSDVSEDKLTNNSKSKYFSDLFVKLIKQSVWHSPSLLILENLDFILTKEVEHGDSGDSHQLTELLIKTFENQLKSKKINILVTSKSKDSINQIIFQRHFVDEEINLEAPNKYQLVEILKSLIMKNFSKYSNDKLFNQLIDITSDLDGYLPVDLKNLIDRAFHNMISENMESLQYSNFVSAIEGYTPTSLRGVKLQKSTTNWEDIGGLIEVKRILLETLEWPTKYAPIFEKCSLRLRSGILLYGYPGCGKTMLASAISSQCGLNFISVKGPEILNKYIGASEQSIRELFERAQSAKPCILFFDEFDSIAPKRGHDSTGVTDRIVNQLLTQMDGAEGLEGVYVLAATSRPDLIDSALLRPGRLDKSVICDLPDYENRYDILKTVVQSNGFKLEKSGDELIEIAKLTSGYTGADLQAVVYNAYLKGVHKSLDETSNNLNNDNESNGNRDIDLKFKEKLSITDQRKYSNTEQVKKKIETIISNISREVNDQNTEVNVKENIVSNHKKVIYITLSQLQESLEETKRSISAKELEKLTNIYAQFESSKRPGEMKDGEGSKEVGVRSTLM